MSGRAVDISTGLTALGFFVFMTVSINGWPTARDPRCDAAIDRLARMRLACEARGAPKPDAPAAPPA